MKPRLLKQEDKIMTTEELERYIENGASDQGCKEHCIYARRCAYNAYGITIDNCRHYEDWDDIDTYEEEE